MFDFYGQLTLFGLAAAIGAASIALLLIFLQQREYLHLGIAVVAGMTVMLILEGIMIGSMPRLQELEFLQQSGVPARPGLLMLVGIVLLISAAMQFRGKGGSNSSGDRLKNLLERVGPVSAFAIGIVLMLTNIKVWALALASVETIREFAGSTTTAAIDYMLFVFLAVSILLIPVAAQVIAPNRSATLLDRVSAWMKKNSYILVAAVTGLIGLYLFVKGFAAFV